MAKILKSAVPIVTKIISECISEKIFKNEFKLTEVTLIFKKTDCIDKENYRSVTHLLHMLKVFERIL